jgi:hypothetical protein
MRLMRLDRIHQRDRGAVPAGLDHRGDQIGRPANAALTEPSRRLRTQPSSARRRASCSVQARKPTPCTCPRIITRRMARDALEARRLFGLAAADCPKSFIEYEGARAELKALGASQ